MREVVLDAKGAKEDAKNAKEFLRIFLGDLCVFFAPLASKKSVAELKLSA
jgi:hypothetical protein